MKARICDVCKKRIVFSWNYILKKPKLYKEVEYGYSRRKIKMDICEDCYNKMIDYAEERNHGNK